VIAPLLPLLLGPEYQEAVSAVRWLSLLPLLKAVHYFGADALTGAGHQGVRTGIQIGIAVVNLLLNLWLIPLYSWRGAALATLLSDGLMIVVIWASVWGLSGRTAPIRSQPDRPSAVGAESS
jgi:O-antigen/teichoic acid export membrane protein